MKKKAPWFPTSTEATVENTSERYRGSSDSVMNKEALPSAGRRQERQKPDSWSDPLNPWPPLCTCPSQDTVPPGSQRLRLSFLLLFPTRPWLDIIFLQKAILNFYSEKRQILTEVRFESWGTWKEFNRCCVSHFRTCATWGQRVWGRGWGDQRTLRHTEGQETVRIPNIFISKLSSVQVFSIFIFLLYQVTVDLWDLRLKLAHRFHVIRD